MRRKRAEDGLRHGGRDPHRRCGRPRALVEFSLRRQRPGDPRRLPAHQYARRSPREPFPREVGRHRRLFPDRQSYGKRNGLPYRVNEDGGDSWNLPAPGRNERRVVRADFSVTSITRLAYLVSHPIQYQAPLLQRIAGDPDIDLHVLFMSDFSLRTYEDLGFGCEVR